MIHFQGIDIPDIDLVVQFMVAHSLSILTQRFGRAGRSGRPAIAILLAEPSVFQVKKKKSVTKPIAETAGSEDAVKEEPDDEHIYLPSETQGLDDTADACTEYRKKTEAGLHDWCITLGCRKCISDKYFNNPPGPDGTSFCQDVRIPH